MEEDGDLSEKVWWKGYHLALFWKMIDIAKESEDWDKDFEQRSLDEYVCDDMWMHGCTGDVVVVNGMIGDKVSRSKTYKRVDGRLPTDR